VSFERAVELDPGFAAAYAWASRGHSAMVHFGYDRSEARLAAAKETADRALALAPDLIDAHVALGFYYYWGRKDYEPALVAAARALEIQPDFIPALELKAWSLRRVGRFEEALDILLHILEFAPGSALTLHDIADTYQFLRRYPEAVRYNELSILAEPGQTTAYRQWAHILRLQDDVAAAHVKLEGAGELAFTRDGWFPQYLAERSPAGLFSLAKKSKGDLFVSQNIIVSAGEIKGLARTLLKEPDRARAAYLTALAPLDSAVSANPNDARAYMSIGRVYAGLGRRDDAIRAGEKGFSLYNPTMDALSGQFFAEELAIIYAMAGEPEKALSALEKLLSSPAQFSVETIKQDPRYDGLRGEKGYKELLERFGG